MATARTDQKLDQLLAGPIGRENFDDLVQGIYENYASVDLVDGRIKQMEADLPGLKDDERRDVAEKVGILHLARGNYEAAVERLREVRTRKTASHFLGRAYLKLGRDEEALECLAAGSTGDDDLVTDVLLAEAHCNLRQPEQAEKLLKRHKDADESADYHYALGRLAEAEGEYGEAIDHFETALQKEPAHPQSLFHLALNCDLNGDDDRAMTLYQRCTALRPTYVGALINLGVLYEDHGMYDEAIDCYKRVLAIDPRHKQAQLYLKDAESSLTMHLDVSKVRRVQHGEDIFSLPVSSFELSARSRSMLERRDVITLGGLAKLTREELLEEKNFGDTSLQEIEQLLAHYSLELGEAAGAEAAEGTDAAVFEKLQTPVDTLELSTRCRKCMERLGVSTVGQLVDLTEEELLAVPNFGATSLNEVKAKLAGLGLSLKSE
jgi:DNA-directed RNA polymerase subunit alpha